MNKEEVVSSIATKAGVTKKAANDMLAAFSETLTEALQKEGDKVQINGVAVFTVRHRAARTGRNPQTGAPVQIPAKLVVTAKSSVKTK